MGDGGGRLLAVSGPDRSRRRVEIDEVLLHEAGLLGGEVELRVHAVTHLAALS